MDKSNIKLLKDTLSTQLDSYGVNQFSADVLSHFENQKNTGHAENEINSIVTAKNDWESCVDALENQAIVILDDQLKVIRVNRTIELWGWGEVNKVIGSHILNLIKPDIEKKSVNDWLDEWCQLDIQKNAEWESSSDLSDKKYRFSFYPIKDIDSLYHSDNCYAVFIITDISDRMNYQGSINTKDRRASKIVKENDVLLKTENRLHVVAQQLINSQEYERKRVSSELHDGVGQVLSALKFQVESIVNESNKSSQKRKNDATLNNVLENIKVALKDLRRISVDLRPSVIDELGLLMALKWFANEYIKVYTDINIDLQINVYESKISDDKKDTIYRIVQEALNNIAKHACARNILVQLSLSNNGMLLRISDDGYGFCVKECNMNKGLGLMNMKERAEKTDGKFTLSSSPLSGTAVQVYWSH